MSVDNSDLGMKVAIRKRLAAHIGKTNVLECYAGEGHTRRAAWTGHKVTTIDARKLPGATREQGLGAFHAPQVSAIRCCLLPQAVGRPPDRDGD